jgi:predicted amidohydrolase YtcJ
VGDGAIAAVLEALEDTGGVRWKPLRPRIEHADLLDAADFPRAARMGVIIVQNPTHFAAHAGIQARWGARAARADQIKAIVDAGVAFAIGSDGATNPYLNIMFATANPANASQSLTVAQALDAYTKGAAFAEFTERQKGTIAPGMLADVALLSQDIFRAPSVELPDIRSMLTIVNGRVVYEK